MQAGSGSFTVTGLSIRRGRRRGLPCPYSGRAGCGRRGENDVFGSSSSSARNPCQPEAPGSQSSESLAAGNASDDVAVTATGVRAGPGGRAELRSASPRARLLVTTGPRGMATRATARPSGTLWSATPVAWQPSAGPRTSDSVLTVPHRVRLPDK